MYARYDFNFSDTEESDSKPDTLQPYRMSHWSNYRKSLKLEIVLQ